MRRPIIAALAACLVGTGAGGASAQPPSVDVQRGPAVQARAGERGRADLEGQRLELQQEVQNSAVHGRNPPAHVSLVIQDIQPNRPTSNQLGLSAGLSPNSLGLGGAAITGQVVGANGTARPVRYRFFQTDLANETNFTTWGDAGEAFDTLARDIADGRPPHDDRTWPPPRPPQAPTGTRLLN